jgi:hypothetical protein
MSFLIVTPHFNSLDQKFYLKGHLEDLDIDGKIKLIAHELREGKVRLKFSLEQATKIYRGSGGIAPLFL